MHNSDKVLWKLFHGIKLFITDSVFNIVVFIGLFNLVVLSILFTPTYIYLTTAIFTIYMYVAGECGYALVTSLIKGGDNLKWPRVNVEIAIATNDTYYIKILHEAGE